MTSAYTETEVDLSGFLSREEPKFRGYTQWSHVTNCKDPNGLELVGNYVRVTMVDETGYSISQLYTDEQWIDLCEQRKGIVNNPVVSDIYERTPSV